MVDVIDDGLSLVLDGYDSGHVSRATAMSSSRLPPADMMATAMPAKF